VGKEGQKHYTTEVKADKIVLLAAAAAAAIDRSIARQRRLPGSDGQRRPALTTTLRRRYSLLE
jgi:hypothetical protein